MYRNFLIAAANGKVREALSVGLREKGHSVTLAATGSEALLVLRNVAVDIVLVESHLPDMRAEQLRPQVLQIRPGCRVICLTSFGAVRNSPELLRFGMDEYVLRTDQIVELLGATLDSAQDGSTTLAERGMKALVEVVDVLVGVLELSDRFFGGCSHQAMRLARAVAGEMSVEEETLDEVVVATLLRDIGKAGLDQEVLSEPGAFTEEQMERMKGHVNGSLRLLEHIDFPWKVIPVIRHHHERYDGKGYPDGLRGREIPIGARILAVVDAYVAMVSERSHRPAMPPEDVELELVRLAGTQFDPEVVEVLLRVLEDKETSRGTRQRPLVLVLDPQEEFRNLLRMRLLNEGLDVEGVSSTEDALERLLKSPPDLILADVHSEGSDAFQLLREIREDDSLRSIPFAFLASREDRILKVRALRQGVDDFLLKTTNLEEIAARVENILIRESTRRDGAGARRRRGITGQIENLPLPDIVQTLTIGMKTACVTLSRGKQHGKIWFEDGSIKHARAGELDGDRAVYEMIRWASGEFVIEHGVKTKKTSITHEAMFLLMEGFRLMDEESQAAAPPGDGDAGEPGEQAGTVVMSAKGTRGRPA